LKRRDYVDQLKFGSKFCSVFADKVMQPYLRHLHTYVSVSGPHLGYLYSSNSLFNSGMWFLKKLKNTQCIHQLSCTDDPDLQNTFLYKLCKVWKCPTKFGIKYHEEFLMELFILHSFFQKKTLEHFRNVILISSPQVLPSLFVTTQLLAVTGAQTTDTWSLASLKNRTWQIAFE